MILEGRTWVFGDNVDTDQIIPARYLNTVDPAELAKHSMEDADPTFAGKVKTGDMVVAGKNFGCGSSREHAPVCLKAAGVSLVIAVSFARIFYRNAINIGLPILECREAGKIAEGDRLAADLGAGSIRNLRTGETYRTAPFPPFMQEVIRAGGLVPFIREELAGGSGQPTGVP